MIWVGGGVVGQRRSRVGPARKGTGFVVRLQQFFNRSSQFSIPPRSAPSDTPREVPPRARSPRANASLTAAAVDAGNSRVRLRRCWDRAGIGSIQRALNSQARANFHSRLTAAHRQTRHVGGLLNAEARRRNEVDNFRRARLLPLKTPDRLLQCHDFIRGLVQPRVAATSDITRRRPPPRSAGPWERA